MARQTLKGIPHEMAPNTNRRQFLQFAAQIGLAGAAMGFSGMKPLCAFANSQARTGELASLPGRPWHHTSEGFRNLAGSLSHKHKLSNWAKHIWHEVSRQEPDVPRDHFLDHNQAAAGFWALGNKDKITWLGHSAFVIRLSGTNILVDPFLSEYATFMPPFGPRRFTPPGLPVEKLPKIDVILISHNHYDHLDVATVTALPDREKIRLIVPLGLKNLWLVLGYNKVTELDWYQTGKSGPVSITALPAVHFSGRSLLDKNQTLWAGYAITDGRTRIHFCGDTAYHPVFKEIGAKFGPFDYCMVPIGAYRPAPERNTNHVTPEAAVKLGRDVKATHLIPMHWGTVVLSQAPPFEAPIRFQKAGHEKGYDTSALWKMTVGETRLI